jgi:dCMP deaminase
MDHHHRVELNRSKQPPDLPLRMDPPGEIRPSVDGYFMEIAHHLAKRSTCFRRSVGAVIVKDKHLLATGYNGVPRGLTHCIHTGCIRMGNPNLELFEVKSVDEIRSFFSQHHEIPSGQFHELCTGVHAEENAIIQAAYFGVSIRDSDVYTTTFPCVNCAKIMINARIRRVIYQSDYVDPISRELIEESSLIVERFVPPKDEGITITMKKKEE